MEKQDYKLIVNNLCPKASAMEGNHTFLLKHKNVSKCLVSGIKWYIQIFPPSGEKRARHNVILGKSKLVKPVWPHVWRRNNNYIT